MSIEAAERSNRHRQDLFEARCRRFASGFCSWAILTTPSLKSKNFLASFCKERFLSWLLVAAGV